MSAILKRELNAYFSSATAYVVMAVFFFFSGLFFNYYCISANSSSLSYVFGNMFYIVLFLIPIITMKTFAEEKKQKSDQALLTAPTSLTEIVLGKFMGAFILYFICCCIFLVYALVISFFSTPEWSVIICTFIGMLLLGAALIAINNPLLTFPGHFSSTIKQPSHSAMPVYSRGISLLSSIFSPYQTSVLLIWSASTFMNSFFLDLLTGTLY